MGGTSYPALIANHKIRASELEAKFDWVENSLVPFTDGNKTNGVYDLGEINYRWRNLYLSDKIYFNTTTSYLYSPSAGNIAFIGADISIPTTKKLYLDGGGDTYIYEGAANDIYIYAGGQDNLYLNATRAEFRKDVYLQPTKKLYFDGGGNTYIYESSNDNVDIVCGANLMFEFSGSGLLNISYSNFAVSATKKLYLDGAGDTYIYEQSTNSVSLVVGNTSYQEWYSSQIIMNQDVVIQSTKKLIFAGDANTYINFTNTSHLQFYASGNRWIVYNPTNAAMNIASYIAPDSAGGRDLGTSSYYWGEVNYKTITDRGCLGCFDDGVECQNGTITTDIKALTKIKKHPTKKTIYGKPMLDYKTFPKVSYKKAETKEDGIFPRDENDEPIGGADGIEMTSMFSIFIGAFKELSNRIEALETK